MTVIDDTAVAVASSGLIQNLGPDEAYLGGSSVTPESGFRLASGEAVAIGLATSTLYAVSAGSSDIRVLNRATGVFPIKDVV